MRVCPHVVAGDGEMQIQALTCEMFTQAWCKLWQPAPREWCLRQISGEKEKRERKPKAHSATHKDTLCVSV